MTNQTQTATAIARLTKMLNDYQRYTHSGNPTPDPPAMIKPQPRVDMELVLNVILRQQARIAELEQRVFLLTAEPG